ncbi:DUF3182 family protein [Pusillimonas caeni]|uniref:DUF3182 family protein n=1 Tax=Pusillimonas caeni TaxID=1348472 RepID=UPI000E59ECCD|nr:DUF3182 family protein [Pusillimonas caeni]TFL08464.1 DUF3182 family protein [Pusillimonas caeni]
MAATLRLAEAKNGPRTVVAFPRRQNAPPHECASQEALARKLAGLLELDFAADYSPHDPPHAGGIYYVPSRTLVRTAAPEPFERFVHDIRGDEDLFGGIVPYDFVATKAITHALLHPDSMAPEGWSHSFSRDAGPAVLLGATVFSMADARLAGIRLLALGPIRIKPVRASGGRGQILASDRREFEEALAAQDEEEIARHGLVLEEHLRDVETYSVGQARAGGMTISYVGTQSLTPDNEAQLVYGGSSLLCARGGYDELLALPLDEAQREAVRLARLYDAAAQRCYPGLFASRRNYDVARGKDARGRIKAGVLEQSWRAGGASFAEACALEAFRASPELNVVRAYTCERYGEHYSAPRDAQIVYRGDDPETGFITKFGAIDSHGDSE